MTTQTAWRIAGGLVYAVATLGLIGGCLFLYLLAKLLLNTSPEYLAWLFGFVS